MCSGSIGTLFTLQQTYDHILQAPSRPPFANIWHSSRGNTCYTRKIILCCTCLEVVGRYMTERSIRSISFSASFSSTKYIRSITSAVYKFPSTSSLPLFPLALLLLCCCFVASCCLCCCLCWRAFVAIFFQNFEVWRDPVLDGLLQGLARHKKSWST